MVAVTGGPDFVEAVASAPSLVVGQVSYVKRVVFPLHALPLVSALAGLFHAGVGLLLFVIAALAVMGHLPATALMLPLVWVPLVGLTLGLVYILAALGVFLRDLGQVIGPILSAMFFLSPVFYPAASMPEVLRPFYRINPVGVVVENTRRVLVMGLAPEWKLLGLWSVGGVGLLMLGFAGFVRCRRAFNDVL